jgi:cytochrome c
MWWKKIAPILLSAIIILLYVVKIQADPAVTPISYPKEYVNMKNPLSFDPPTLREGRKIYAGHCEVCHGAYGDGKGRASLISKYSPMPRDFTNSAIMAQKTDGMLFYSISKGVHGTEMFAREEIMSEEQRWAVIHYIRTFAKDAKE